MFLQTPRLGWRLTQRRVKQVVIAVVVAWLLPLWFTKHAPADKTAYSPPSEVQAYSFSIARADPATVSGLHPADILGIGGLQLIPCANLGLECEDLSGRVDDIAAMSFGSEFAATGLPNAQFSVSSSSQGAPNTAVRAEHSCVPAQAQGDTFASTLDGKNEQDLDGDGIACTSNNGVGVGITETTPSDHLDALEGDPCRSIDLNCDGQPEEPIYITLAKDSPSLSHVGAGTADILVVDPNYGVVIWASATQLGLSSNDAIDALCLNENGNGSFDIGDQLLFSLASGSPSLGVLNASAADLLKAGPLLITHAASFGLLNSDDIDAVLCNATYSSFDVLPPASKNYLPVIQKS